MDSATIKSWMQGIAESMRAERDHLVQLDAAIGDGDHGINMTRGFDAVEVAIAAEPDATPGRLLILSGKTLVSTVGGASGPLWGSALRAAGRTLGDRSEVAPEQLVEALAAALAAIRDLGAAAPGDKTMVDALEPAVDALRADLAAGKSLTEALAAAEESAAAGMRGTIPAAGAQGQSVLPGRAVDRPPGPRRDLNHADHRRPPESNRRGGLVSGAGNEDDRPAACRRLGLARSRRWPCAPSRCAAGAAGGPDSG